MVKECKNMVKVLDNSLLKSDQFFMFRSTRFSQQNFQFLFKVVPGLVRPIIIGSAAHPRLWLCPRSYATPPETF